MLFPIADIPKAPARPYVTWGLMAINIVVFLLISYPATKALVDLRDPVLMEYLHTFGLYGRISPREIYQNLSAYDLLVFEYGLRPAAFSLKALFTSMFLHGGFMHLAGNMLFLYIFGNNVEYRLGWWRFLLAYLGSGVIASLFFTMFSLSSQAPLIGASGAIFGVLGCYFLWFPKNRIRCFIFLFPFIITTILLPARWILGFYLVIDNILPFLFSGTQSSSIAHGAHIGGFIGGLGIAWLGNHRRGLFFARRKAAGAFVPSFSSLQQICPAVREGRFDAAAQCYFGLAGREQRQQVATEDLLAVGDYLLRIGDSLQALILYRRLISERPKDPRLDHAYLGAGRSMLLHNPRYMTSAYHYFLAAIDLSRDDQLIERARNYLREIEKGRIPSDKNR